MRGLISDTPTDSVNPYIGLSDSILNLVLILILFIAVILMAILQREDTYKTRQDKLKMAVAQMPESVRPTDLDRKEKNDPPGTQRFTFPQHLLFESGTANLTAEGRKALTDFINVLANNGDTWRRVRIEGHTMPTAPGEYDNWKLATDRAAAVAFLMTNGSCKMTPNVIATSGRGGQAPLKDLSNDDPHQERVDIILEYGDDTAGVTTCN